jgi:hypothetical protein
MKRVLLVLSLATTLLGAAGCNMMDRNCNSCNSCNGNLGCRPCRLGWQRGGTDYQRFLGGNGMYRHGGGDGGAAAQGPTSAQVAYPYYTTRGPRDFLLDNPPTIGR